MISSPTQKATNTWQSFFFSFFYPCGKIPVQWSVLAGTRGCTRTWYVSGWERKMRQGRVVRPEGNRGTLLTDWRPDRLHRPHSPQSREPLFIHPSLHPAFAASLSAPRAPLLQPSTLPAPSPLDLPPSCHLGLSLTKATCLPVSLCLLLWLPLATRHSQMSAGSCITETARLSAVVTWHLKAVRAWDTVTSHSTLIAVYWLLEDSCENKAAEWYHKAKGCFFTFSCVCYQIKNSREDWLMGATYYQSIQSCICVSVHLPKDLFKNIINVFTWERAATQSHTAWNNHDM